MKIFTVSFISLFVFAFLYVFQPFGMSQMNWDPLPVAAGYGIVTFVVSILTNILVPRLFPSTFNEENWTVLKEIIYIQLVIMLVAAGNLFYTSWLGYDTLSIKGFLNFELITLAVAVIPVTILILAKQNLLLKRNLNEANQLSENLYMKKRLLSMAGETVTIQAENPKDNLVLEINCIYFIAAADNYVEVVYSNNNTVVKKMMRTTMRNVQGNLKLYSQFYRCHRAFIINLEKVKKVTGNAQGYRLILEDNPDLIPVARSMNKEINLRLRR